MQLTTESLRTPHQWWAVLGCDAHDFQSLLVIFREAYHALPHAQLADRMLLKPIKSRIATEEELLFFTLFSCKSGLTYDVRGYEYGMNGATAKRRQEKGLEMLREAFKKAAFARTGIFFAGRIAALFYETTGRVTGCDRVRHAPSTGKTGAEATVQWQKNDTR